MAVVLKGPTAELYFYLFTKIYHFREVGGTNSPRQFQTALCVRNLAVLDTCSHETWSQ
jgi:hypothetical protein